MYRFFVDSVVTGACLACYARQDIIRARHTLACMCARVQSDDMHIMHCVQGFQAFQLKVEPARNHRTRRLCHLRVIRPIVRFLAFLGISAVLFVQLCRRIADFGLWRQAA